MNVISQKLLIKTCPLCGETKPREKFFNKGNGKRLSRCTACMWRKKAVRSREALLRGRRLWASRNQEKVQCHKMVHAAIDSGTLVKPEKCSRCASSGIRIEAHHSDYSRPLEVVWLCHRCHRQEAQS